MELGLELKMRAKIVDDYLEKLMPQEWETPATIHRSMRYSLFAGGKRLRPILVMAAAEAVGTDPTKVLPIACAFEMIHTYSLIHDDLPAMDNDDFRRGKATNHKVFGEAMAILAGDGLLTLAFQVAAQNYFMTGVDPKAVLLVINEMAEASGTKGMIGGQVMDTEAENKQISPEVMQNIHSHKTGALFKASMRAGAILSGADEVQLIALTEYADNLGLAFQIIDDILDIEGDEAKLGKKVGSDIANNKSTYPALFGLEESKGMAKEAIDNATQALLVFDEKAQFLREIAKYMLQRDN